MSAEDSSTRRSAGLGRNDIPSAAGRLDEVDRHIVRLLARDARMPNNALAERVGIAPSTCLGRMLHVAATSTERLRDFVVDLSTNRDIASTQTNLIFEHHKGDIGD